MNNMVSGISMMNKSMDIQSSMVNKLIESGTKVQNQASGNGNNDAMQMQAMQEMGIGQKLNITA